MNGLKEKQEEFKKKYCSSCFRFDPQKKDYREKGHRGDANDCKHHITDAAGQCWNYHERKTAEAELTWLKKEKSIIELPKDDPRKIEQLNLKLLEYEQRIDPYRPRASQMDTICKSKILSRLLKKGSLNVYDFMIEMEKEQKDSFSRGNFFHACNVIDDYVITGGANRRGKGTGLRPL
ncbi:MAG: hypothetical protein A2175_00360 [Candidatus Nealsonbacteria bacterium RBG_13_42_11]|uniref:Uncharacterized protein n=1 Tax=Candidatus Nealsonbacteria bacterium RBG_13_42_11 TaxID=1801663 RepID=A0A1G2DYR5_9BACT|nr:MAG: hypothetical protein A2175_00360 [Candidatus Nealsonbacteria bacterium RBG_13_42_11]